MSNPIVQNEAVIREYNDALRDGNYTLAGRIRKANPDLIDNDVLAFVPERGPASEVLASAGARVKSPVRPREDWKVKTVGLGLLADTLNELTREGYYPFSIIPQKGAYGINHYVIVAGDLKL